MRIAIAGGNGFIGKALTARLSDAGHDVVWLSHRPGRALDLPDAMRPSQELAFTLDDSAPWRDEIHAIEAIVNLSGSTIGTRWNDEVRHRIVASRIETTRVLVEALRDASEDGVVRTLVNASAIGIYGDRGDDVLTEAAACGDDWLASVAVRWERTAMQAADAGVRVVTPRTGIVLGSEGFLPRMTLPMRLFTGGPIGSGEQWLSWIHIDDIAGVYEHLIAEPALSGPVNAVSPAPVRMDEFARALGHVMHRPSWFRVPTPVLRIPLGEFARYAVMSQRVSCARLVESGFAFEHPSLEAALNAALR